MRQILIALACISVCAAAAAPYAYVPYLGGVTVIDTATNRFAWDIPMPGAAPAGVAMAPDGSRAYFGDVLSGQVHVVDTATQSVMARIGVPSGPAALALNPSGSRLVVGSAGILLVAGSTLSLIDTATRSVIASGESGLRPAAAVFNHDGSRIFVANGESHSITIHDAETLETLGSIAVATGPLSLALHPSGNRLYVGHIGTLGQSVSDVTVIDLESHSIAATIRVGSRPATVLLNPAGTRLYVGSVDNDSVSVIDTSTNAVVSTINVGQSPTGLDLHPDGNRLYVPTHGRGIQVVDLASGRLGPELRLFPYKTIVLGRFIAPPPPASQGNRPEWLSGLWWNANQSGWGLSVAHRSHTVFAAWYTYDASGAPKWYVAPSGTRSSYSQSGTTFSSTLYEVAGPRFFGVPFNPSAATVTNVGTLSLTFTGSNSGTLTYTLNNQFTSVPITRQPISTGSAPGVNYTDLWWNPSESGWGLSVTQQGRVMFLAWFVYDNGGKPIWYVASNCAVNAVGDGCSGTLYRTTGPSFGGIFNPQAVRAFEAGTVTLSFTDGNNGQISYTVDGQAGSKAITRQLF